MRIIVADMLAKDSASTHHGGQTRLNVIAVIVQGSACPHIHIRRALARMHTQHTREQQGRPTSGARQRTGQRMKRSSMADVLLANLDHRVCGPWLLVWPRLASCQVELHVQSNRQHDVVLKRCRDGGNLCARGPADRTAVCVWLRSARCLPM